MIRKHVQIAGRGAESAGERHVRDRVHRAGGRQRGGVGDAAQRRGQHDDEVRLERRGDERRHARRRPPAPNEREKAEIERGDRRNRGLAQAQPVDHRPRRGTEQQQQHRVGSVQPAPRQHGRDRHDQRGAAGDDQPPHHGRGGVRKPRQQRPERQAQRRADVRQKLFAVRVRPRKMPLDVPDAWAVGVDAVRPARTGGVVRGEIGHRRTAERERTPGRVRGDEREQQDRAAHAGDARQLRTHGHLTSYPAGNRVANAGSGCRMESGELVRAALARSARRFLACEAHLRERDSAGDLDEEAVHDARVAVRRLRSDLRSFRAFLDEAWTDALRAELEVPADVLGAARDADALLARVSAHAGDLSEEDRAHLDDVLAPLRAERDAAYVRVRATLASESHAALVETVRTGALEAPLAPRAACDAASGSAAIVRDAWKPLRKAVRRCGDPPTDAELHRVRIKAKRVRYAAEALEPTFGRGARVLARRVARLQDVLGEQHDAVLAVARLRRATWDPRLAFVAGQLAALEHAEALRCRTRWRRAWRRAKRRRFAG